MLTYHAVGKRILAAKLSERAGYANAVLQRLANELGLSERLLQRAVAFAKLYPTPPKSERRLRWAHYRELVGLKDARVRTFYEEQALKQRWSRDKLVEAIRNQRHRFELSTTIASPERVIDGETLMVMIDLGFHLYKRQRVRLALVDAPKLSDATGKEAQAFVQEQLAAVEFIMLTTVTIDHHGRYTAHVFYQPDSRDEGLIYKKGKHLNQELVQRGLVAVV